ncbi:MAG TPA: thiol:disulfide interchange protein DsbA/DsbL [Gammaproteobacteria bacterium]|nr:thiol:disulfide interchange protein DsbA/DsbL [Gammaproteobacteria bacterium]
MEKPTVKKTFALVFSLLLVGATAVAGEFKEGVQYQALASPQPTDTDDRIEVIEFFWYGCPHCYRLEPELEAWVKKLPDDVAFRRVPAVLGPAWELLARAYYTAEVLDAVDKVHQPLFGAIHKQRKRFRTVDDVAALFAAQGVPEAEFRKAWKSFPVVMNTNRARQARERYGLEGVPTLVVNGKYRTSATLAGSNETMLKVVDYLIDKERVAGKKGKE